MMSDARRTPGTDSAAVSLEQNQQHPERVSDSAGQLDRLADLIFSADERDFDPEELDALLADLDASDPLPVGAIPDPRRSLAEFRSGLDRGDAPNPVGPEFHSKPRKMPRRMTLRKLLPIAATLILMISMMIPTASGSRIFELLGRWTAEIFQLEDDTDNYAVIRNRPLVEGERKEYDTPQEMLEDFGIDAKLVPTWVPERMGEPDVSAIADRQGVMLYMDYSAGNVFLNIDFIEQSPRAMTSVEKDYQDADIKIIDQIVHHVMIDKNITKIIWENGELECRMTGNLPWEEMEQVLYSIYED